VRQSSLGCGRPARSRGVKLLSWEHAEGSWHDARAIDGLVQAARGQRVVKAPRANRAWSAPLADFVEKALDPVLAKQGFGQSDVVLHWEEIAGRRLAQASAPLRISWPTRGAKRDPLAPVDPAVLVLQVEGAFALEVQHLAPVILERVNAHLGWRCVGRIQIRQGPVRRPGPLRAEKPSLDPAVRASAQRASAEIADEALRAAVTRLGEAVLSGSNKIDT
jgi:hypothetical protein